MKIIKNCIEKVSYLRSMTIKFFRNLSLRNKLLIGYCITSVIAISLGGLVILAQVQKTIENNIEIELRSSTEIITNMVKTAADVSIKNYLRAVAEDNKAIVENFYLQYQKGKITQIEAKKRARDILLVQPIGKTGYIYCVNSRGIAAVHRNPGVENHDWSHFAFVQEQIKRKEGYLVYDWKNPGETIARPKALYMTYFKPWDWIISAATYRSEFLDLLNMADIRKAITDMHFGKTGYSYVLDGKGNIIIHPALEGNIDDIKDPVLRATAHDVIKQKTGKINYDWTNPGEKVPRKKLVSLNYIPEYDWVVASSCYLDELYQPLYKIRNTILIIIFVILLMVLAFTFWISSAITIPIRKLMENLSLGATGNFSVRMQMPAKDEVGRLSRYFNFFMEKLQEYSDSLQEEISEHKRFEKALRESEERYRSLTENTPDVIYEADFNLKLTYINKSFYDMTGYSEEKFKQGISLRDVIDESDIEQIHSRLKNRDLPNFLIIHKIARNDGSHFFGENHGTLVIKDGVPAGVRGSIRDVTDKLKLEEHILQSKKMETIGTLAGGLAHDFNNVLTGITSTISILHYEIKKDKLDTKRLLHHLDVMERSGQRAADIVQNLLTLSRKREVKFSPVDLKTTIKQVAEICGNTFDKSIEIKVHVPEGSAMVRADLTQMEQVLLNLCVNANHAMSIMRKNKEPWGGRLIIGLEKFSADANFCLTHPDAEVMDYWRLSVADAGVGMDSDTISKIFVPFFTTKEKGTGTGIGLSMVYNFVQQHEGFIDVYSNPGLGTTFNVFLPVIYQETIKIVEDQKMEIPRGTGLILVVDDEELLRDMAKAMLEECGYEVITAKDGLEGVKLFEQRHGEIKAALIDLVMPKLSGDKAYLQMKQINPNLKVVLASGFEQDERVNVALGYGINAFIQKPYTLVNLAKAIAALVKE